MSQTTTVVTDESSPPTEICEEKIFSDEVLQREIQCETQDGDRVPVRVSLLLQSKAFKDYFENMMNMSGEENLNEFAIKDIPTKVFNKVVLWLHEHVGKPEPVIEEDPNTYERKWFTMSEWDLEFYKVELDELADLLIAANFLDIPSLYYSGCQTMAALLKEKTPEQIREMFGLKDDLSDEEKAELRRKSVWCNY